LQILHESLHKGFLINAKQRQPFQLFAHFPSLGMNPDNPTTEVIAPKNQTRKREQNMKTKTKNSKVAKAAKTRLIDLTPSKDARGGKISPEGGPIKGVNGGPAGTPPYVTPPVTNNPKLYTI
jgi:hypothetical protein